MVEGKEIDKLKIQRLESIENKANLRLDINAYCEEYCFFGAEPQTNIRVVGELSSPDLKEDIKITAIAYNQNNEIIGIKYGSEIISSNFEGIEPFDFKMEIIKGEELGRLLVFPVRFKNA